jgi:hypothetical protein
MKRPFLAALLAGSFLSPLMAPAFALQSSNFKCRCARHTHAIANAPHPQRTKNRIATTINTTGKNVPDPLANQIVARAKVVAERTGTIGWCYRAVKAALAPFHIDLVGGYAWMAAPQLMQDKRFHIVPQPDLRPGDIMVHGKSGTHPAGHIAVYLGNNAEASDHLQQVILGGTYGKTLVFRLKPKQIRAQQRIALNGSTKKGPPHGSVTKLKIAKTTKRVRSSSPQEMLISDAN